MSPRTVTTEKYGLRIVTREMFGRDRATREFVSNAILNAVYPRLGVKTAGETPNAIYAVMVDVARIIVQTVSLEEIEDSDAHWPDGLVLPNPSNYPACIAFYDCLMDLPDRYTAFLLEGVRAADADIPNVIGGKTAKPSQPALASASSTTAAD